MTRVPSEPSDPLRSFFTDPSSYLGGEGPQLNERIQVLMHQFQQELSHVSISSDFEQKVTQLPESLQNDRRLTQLLKIIHFHQSSLEMTQSEREQISSLALELLQAAPNTDVENLLYSLERISSTEVRAQTCSLALHWFRSKPNIDINSVISHIKDLLSYMGAEIGTFALDVLQAAPNTDVGLLLYSLGGISSKEDGADICSRTLYLLQVAPNIDASSLIRNIKDIQHKDREDICSHAFELLRVSPNTHIQTLFYGLKEISQKEDRAQICSLALDFFRVNPNTNLRDLLFELSEVPQAAPNTDVEHFYSLGGISSKEDRADICSRSLYLLQVAPNIDASSLIRNIRDIQHKDREDICSHAFELLRVSPNTHIQTLFYGLKKIAQKEDRAQICSLALDSFRVNPNTNLGDLLFKLSEGPQKEDSAQISSLALELFQAALDTDFKNLLFVLGEISSEEERANISSWALYLLQVASNIDASTLIPRIRDIPKEDREEICSLALELRRVASLALELLQVASNTTVEFLLYDLGMIPQKEDREEICSLALELLQVAHDKQIGKLLSVLHAIPQKEDRAQIHALALYWLRSKPNMDPYDIIIYLKVLFQEDGADTDIGSFALDVLRAAPNTDVQELLDSLINISNNEREHIVPLALGLLKSAPNTDAITLIRTLTYIPKDQRFLIYSHALELLEVAPNTDPVTLILKLRESLPQKERIWAFAKIYLKNHPDENAIELLKFCLTIQGQYLQLDQLNRREFLPLLTPEQVRATIAAATPEEKEEALNHEIYVKETGETGPISKMLVAGVVDMIQTEEQTYTILEDNIRYFSPLGLQAIRDFLDSISPFALSVAAAHEDLQPILLRYLYAMSDRHLSVVLPHLPMDKLQETLGQLQEQQFEIDHIVQLLPR